MMDAELHTMKVTPQAGQGAGNLSDAGRLPQEPQVVTAPTADSPNQVAGGLLRLSKCHTPQLFALLALLLASLLYFPGTQYLTSDTQIYVPLFEHQHDPSLLTKDPVVQYPHLGLSLYDEIVNGLRTVTDISVQSAIYLHQVVFRMAQITALYAIALALGCGRWQAVWAAALMTATAFISGPSVMVMEYEGVPRGFTFSLALAAVACVLYGRLWLAGTITGLSILYQAGMAYPFLLCFTSYLAFGKQENGPLGWLSRFRYLLPVLAGLAVVVGSSWGEGTGGSASLDLVPDWLAELQKLRASYNYPSLWHPAVLWTPVALGLAAVGAWWRIRRELPACFGWLFFGLPLVGILSIPVAWFLMEKMRWFLMAQFQPARAVAFMYAAAIPVFAAAAFWALRRSKWLEAGGWFLAGLAIPFSNQLVFLAGAIGWPSSRFRFLWAVALAVLAVGAFRLVGDRRATGHPTAGRYRIAGIALAVLLTIAPFWILRSVLNVDAFATDTRSANLTSLSDWASDHTPKDAVFAFPGFGRGGQPGVFRATALRAVYTDWKSGGQVNFSVDFARIWWERWNLVMKEKTFQLDRVPALQALGIDYLVVPPTQAPAGYAALFQNEEFAVFRTADLTGIPAS